MNFAGSRQRRREPGLSDRRTLLRQCRFSELHPIAGAQWQYRVVGMVMRVVQHRRTLGIAVADPETTTAVEKRRPPDVSGRSTAEGFSYSGMTTHPGGGSFPGCTLPHSRHVRARGSA